MTQISKPPTPSPIASKDRAETFAESDVTATHSKTRVDSESVGFGFVDGSTVSRATDDGSTSRSAKSGLKINPNVDLPGVKASISGNTSGATTAYITDTNGNVLNSSSVSSGSFQIELSLTAGTGYLLVVDDGGDSYTAGDVSESYPITSSDIDITEGIVNDTGSTTNFAQSINDVTALEKPSSGSVTLEWPVPNDVYRWDAASFTSSPDGETVNVYVEENDGSGWTEIAGPIQRGDSIPADPGSQVRFRVDISRSSTSNNPTLDSIYRRWVV